MKRARSLLLLLVVLFSAIAPVANAQEVTLLADSIVVQGDTKLVATGDVEVFSNDGLMRAQKIIYDSDADSISIQGPITLIFSDGTTTFAKAGELSSDLQDGILQSARMILDQQIQIAAVELHRVAGRYTQLYKSVASSCRVCQGQGAPLWEVRAKSIIHDRQERFLYFDQAQLRLGGVPVFYIPRLRLPDPSLKRATGFLQPNIRTTSRLGSGIKIPYFVVLSDSSDITFTPYISNVTNTMELRYRRAYKTGRLQFDAALTSDELQPGTMRAYLFGQGNFTLPQDFELNFDFETTSDPAYLLEYGYSDKDRLENQVSITRTRANEHFEASLIQFQTLRGSELAIDDQLPNIQGEVNYSQRFYPTGIGGSGNWSLGVETHNRLSNADILGRDMAHIGARMDWSRTEVFGPGILARAGLELELDSYLISEDSTYAPFQTYFSPAAEFELKWPLVNAAESGAAFVLEPTIHLAWAPDTGIAAPNDDSTLVEFDEGNLFDISRFPGDDRNETGTRLTLGTSWTRYDPGGWSLGVVAGRVFRQSDTGLFSAASGLDGIHSDWLLASQLKLQPGLSLTTRALIADSLQVTKAEARLDWTTTKFDVGSTYSWIIPDSTEHRNNVVSQATLKGQYRFHRHWTANAEFLYDFTASKTTSAKLGLKYINECMSVNLSLSRRFTSSSSVTPTTDLDFSVNLLGFGSDGGIARRTCSAF